MGDTCCNANFRDEIHRDLREEDTADLEVVASAIGGLRFMLVRMLVTDQAIENLENASIQVQQGVLQPLHRLSLLYYRCCCCYHYSSLTHIYARIGLYVMQKHKSSIVENGFGINSIFLTCVVSTCLV